MAKITLQSIRTDGGTQPRTCLNDWYVEQLMQTLEADGKLPPVDLFYDGTDYWLADGFHRYEAHSKAGKDTIAATVHQGTKEDAQWFSYSANKTHDVAGLRRTNADKERAVRAAIAHPKAETLSNVKLAEHIGVSESMVRAYRTASESGSHKTNLPKREGKDGKMYPANKPRPTMPAYEPPAQTVAETITIDKDTGEVLDEPPMRMPSRYESHPKPPTRKGRGIELAHEAINVLKRIPVNDALRADGLALVARWIKDNK